jgi:hypothetical protein
LLLVSSPTAKALGEEKNKSEKENEYKEIQQKVLLRRELKNEGGEMSN